jgi:membrane protein
MLKGTASPTSGRSSAVVRWSSFHRRAGVGVKLKDAMNTIFEVEEPEGVGFAWYARVYAVSCAGILTLGVLLAISLVMSPGLAACVADEFGGSERAT